MGKPVGKGSACLREAASTKAVANIEEDALPRDSALPAIVPHWATSPRKSPKTLLTSSFFLHTLLFN